MARVESSWFSNVGRLKGPETNQNSVKHQTLHRFNGWDTYYVPGKMRLLQLISQNININKENQNKQAVLTTYSLAFVRQRPTRGVTNCVVCKILLYRIEIDTVFLSFTQINCLFYFVMLRKKTAIFERPFS